MILLSYQGDDMMIVSLNGMDNAGKTTQTKILTTEHADTFIKKYHINDTSSFDREKFNSKWWFARGNGEEFTDSIFNCLYERNQLALDNNVDDKIIILEKGVDSVFNF